MAETALIAVDMDISAIHKRLAEIEGATKEEARQGVAEASGSRGRARGRRGGFFRGSGI